MLKILVVMERDTWVNLHIAGSLEEMGHKVHRHYYGDFIGEFYGKTRSNERIEKNKQLVHTAKQLLQDEGLDLIFCYAQDDFLLPDYARALSKLDIPFVNYNVDMSVQWYRQIRIAKYFTCVLCAQTDNMNNLKKYGAKVSYFPMAARKSLLATHSDPSEFVPAAPVTFMGTPTDQRLKIISVLVNASVPLAVYGKYWKMKQVTQPIVNMEKTLNDIWYYGLAKLRGGGLDSLIDALKRRFINYKKIIDESCIPDQLVNDFLPDNVTNTLFKKSKINLGFTRFGGNDPYQIGKYQMKLRDFEVPLAGGFYLVEKAPDYEKCFVPEKEVVTWTTPNELIEKISYYLEHDNERETIAKAGQNRALKEHTWDHRFNKLFHELGIH